ncbi:putative ribonuclease H protein [Ananas comosus]|uniref:Putative ribonuclease H protein n=1 Tax=Ananas comosus TaxID=4615 RepID=A0A199UZV6_ANACO|nr:putative ribonuclease H protein [Ananas comosus]
MGDQLQVGWCGDTTLKLAFSEIFSVLDGNPVLVKNCFGNDDWNWARILGDDATLLTGFEPNISALKDRVTSFKVGQHMDVIGWRWCSSGIFSVKSAYRMLNDGGTIDGRTSKIWRLRIPLKVKVFCWLVLKKRPLTTDNLVKRWWTGETACVLCRDHDETVDHLFTQCVFLKYIMVMGLEDVHAEELGDDVLVVWDKWMGKTAVRVEGSIKFNALSASCR